MRLALLVRVQVRRGLVQRGPLLWLPLLRCAFLNDKLGLLVLVRTGQVLLDVLKADVLLFGLLLLFVFCFGELD